MPGDMTVAESHDIALALQHKVEALDDVERCGSIMRVSLLLMIPVRCMSLSTIDRNHWRQADRKQAAPLPFATDGAPALCRCFVHVDFQTREEPEHKVERGLSAALAASAGPPASMSMQDMASNV